MLNIRVKELRQAPSHAVADEAYYEEKADGGKAEKTMEIFAFFCGGKPRRRHAAVAEEESKSVMEYQNPRTDPATDPDLATASYGEVLTVYRLTSEENHAFAEVVFEASGANLLIVHVRPASHKGLTGIFAIFLCGG